jgi:aspartyl-tRNA synthetase
MIAGLEKYFQLARCFRDEDQRADRQPEFTQLDMEMSFVDREGIMQLIEKMMIELVTKIFPEKKIQETPFPRISYADSMKKYKTDKPDLRKEKNDNLLSFAWVIDQPLFEYSEEDKKMVSVHHPFTAPHEFDPEKIKQNPLEISSKAYDIVLNGFELGGVWIRIHQPDLQKIIFEILGLGQDEIDLRFGHLIEALKFGAPPHGGIALGIDRIVALLSGEKSIREVIAFPKTGDARDPLTGAPSSLPEKQLKEANIQILSKKK